MKRHCVLFATVMACTATALADEGRPSTEPASPLVKIEAERTTPRWPVLGWWAQPTPLMPETRVERGVGAVVRADGVVLTARALVDGADVVTVALSDGRRLRGEVAAVHTATDSALVRIDAGGLDALPIADPASLKLGATLRYGTPRCRASAPAMQVGVEAASAALGAAEAPVCRALEACRAEVSYGGGDVGQLTGWAQRPRDLAPGTPLVTADHRLVGVGVTQLTLPLPAMLGGAVHLVHARPAAALRDLIATLPGRPLPPSLEDLLDGLGVWDPLGLDGLKERKACERPLD